MTASPISAPNFHYVDYQPRGAARELFTRHETEVIISGPAGTGKSRAALEVVNWRLEKYPRARGIMIRKSRRSLTQSAMVTFEQKVLPDPDYLHFYANDQEYRYPNGSILAVGGIDDPKKILSSEWDVAYVMQAEELDQGDWESIIMRLRSGKTPYQQIVADCNPDAPHHWIKQRAAAGRLVMLESKHEDNPVLWNGYCKVHQAVEPGWTCFGNKYMADLDRMTGVRHRRYRLGQWAAAEGAVYEHSWERATHIVDRFDIPNEWPRFWAVDFGFTNPFVWAAWAEDPDGRLYRYREIYRTKTLVEDHARTILEVTKGEPKPRAIICDHDAEDRATLQRHLGMKTIPAYKAVSPGIQAVESRLRKADDGKPRLFFMRDSLVEIDEELLREHKPTRTEEEIEAYVWDTSSNRKRGEEPAKRDDHGCDMTRYLISYTDDIGRVKPKLFPMLSVLRSDPVTPSLDNELNRESPWIIR